MTFWRVYSKARSTRVALEGSLNGCTGFLIGGSPKLLSLDMRLLRLPGCWCMAINNAAVVFEPQMFIALDTSKCFNYHIFSNPRIIKMLNYSHSAEEISGKRLCHYPNTFFFDMQDESELMMSEFCKVEGPLPFWRNTFFTALGAMYQLGFKRVYLIGCTFDVSAGAYAHGSDPRESDIAVNQKKYDNCILNLKTLMPMLRDEGMEVLTCHNGTPLAGICDYVPFEQAISHVVTESTDIEFNALHHVRDIK